MINIQKTLFLINIEKNELENCGHTLYVPHFFTILKSNFALTNTPFVHLSPNNQDFAGSHKGKHC